MVIACVGVVGAHRVTSANAHGLVVEKLLTHPYTGIAVDPRFAGRGPVAAPQTVQPATDQETEGDGAPFASAVRAPSYAAAPSAESDIARSVTPDSASLGVTYLHDTASSTNPPPDGSMAVGKNDVVVATNQFLTFRDKTGHQEIPPITTENFFKNPPGKPVVDINVMYDPYINRFWAVGQNNQFGAGGTTTVASRVMVARSDTENAKGTWHVYTGVDFSFFQGAHHEDWCDSDHLAFDAQALYLTCNMTTDAGVYDTDEARIILKSEFMNPPLGVQFILTGFQDLAAPHGKTRNLMPVQMVGATNADGGYFMAADGATGPGSAYSVWKITNVARCCDSNPSNPTVTPASIPTTAYTPAPGARQKGATTRITNATAKLPTPGFWRQNSLQFTQTVTCNWSGGATSSCVKFVQVNVASFPTTSTTNDWTFGVQSFDFYMSAIAPAADGWKTMVYEQSSDSQFVSVHFVAIPPPSVCTKCISGTPQLLKAGSSGYVNIDAQGRNRWGDFFTAASDPDGTHVWIEGEVPVARQTYSTWVGQTKPH